MNLAIISTNKNKYSETFIHNHIKLIPATIHFLFDGYLPKQVSSDKGKTSYPLVELHSKKTFLLFKKKISTEKEVLQSAIENYFKKHKIDAILCEYGPSGVELMSIAKKLNIPLVVHFHGYDAYRDDILNSYGKQYKEVFFISAAIITVSKHMTAQLKKLGCPENKLHHLCYGIDATVFKPNSQKEGTLTFVACGRFVEKKAPHLTIQAFELVLRKTPKAKLIMIGDGELLKDCKELALHLKMSDSIEFKGVQSQAQIAEIYANALAFVQHSITTTQNDSEGTPLTIMEAMSAGLPVISTKHGGITDIIVENETGFLVDEKNVKVMAQKMLFVIENPERAEIMGKAASQFIQANHTLNLYTQKLFELIKNQKNN
jgi:colanic acid/amylovoran biosynthesis glycosyltransferase